MWCRQVHLQLLKEKLDMPNFLCSSEFIGLVAPLFDALFKLFQTISNKMAFIKMAKEKSSRPFVRLTCCLVMHVLILIMYSGFRFTIFAFH